MSDKRYEVLSKENVQDILRWMETQSIQSEYEFDDHASEEVTPPERLHPMAQKVIRKKSGGYRYGLEISREYVWRRCSSRKVEGLEPLAGPDEGVLYTIKVDETRTAHSLMRQMIAATLPEVPINKSIIYGWTKREFQRPHEYNVVSLVGKTKQTHPLESFRHLLRHQGNPLYLFIKGEVDVLPTWEEAQVNAKRRLVESFGLGGDTNEGKDQVTFDTFVAGRWRSKVQGVSRVSPQDSGRKREKVFYVNLQTRPTIANQPIAKTDTTTVVERPAWKEQGGRNRTY